MSHFCFCFFFNDTATPEIYTLSLHDALPIWHVGRAALRHPAADLPLGVLDRDSPLALLDEDDRDDHADADDRQEQLLERARSEEHTSELQSLRHLVCRLLLEKKKKK